MTQTINIALLGCGVVGQGVLKQLRVQKKLEKSRGIAFNIKKVLVRRVGKYQDWEATYNFQLVTDIADIVEDPSIDIVVEVMGGFEPVEDYILASFNHGKHVVSANKNLIAKNGPLLIETAKKNRVAFYYEGAVCGGIPILRTISQAYSSDEIFKVAGIVNGTCNFILSQMSQKQLNYGQALQLAQELGFAEADPTNDVTGLDASFKLVILAHFAYGRTVHLEDLLVSGIENVTAEDIKQARQIGYRIKLIAETKKIADKITLLVWPMLVPENQVLGQIENENNGVNVISNNLGEAIYIGPGAGSQPTSNSVVTDLVVIANEMALKTTGQTFHSFDEDGAIIHKSQLQKSFVLFLEYEENSGAGLEKVLREVAPEQTFTIQHLKENQLAVFTAPMTFAEADDLATHFSGKAYPLNN